MVLFVFIALIILFVILPLIGVALWFVISTAVVGLILGALGRLIVPGQQPIGVLATIICGWAGSLIGGAIGRIIWNSHSHHFFTLLIEIGISAAAVLAWSSHDRKAVRSSSTSSRRVIDI
jgi:uncharacterized membrane protein YeaQ/YmgE (transglycosylase-associated protein family)